MTLHEPSTFLTDCAFTAVSAVLAWRLFSHARSENRAALWFARAFALSAASAFVGGSYHGFAPNFSPLIAAVWWRLTLVSLCAVSAALELSLCSEFTSSASRRWSTVIAAKFAVSSGIALAYPQFAIAIAIYGLSLLIWALAALVARRPWSKWILVGVVLSVAAGIVQQSRRDFSAYFNHNDIYHVIQALALFALYEAARRVGRPSQRVSPPEL